VDFQVNRLQSFFEEIAPKKVLGLMTKFKAQDGRSDADDASSAISVVPVGEESVPCRVGVHTRELNQQIG
jgi:hypothetical protein